MNQDEVIKINQLIDSYELANWELVLKLTGDDLEWIVKRICSEAERLGDSDGKEELKEQWVYKEQGNEKGPLTFDYEEYALPGLKEYTVYGTGWYAYIQIDISHESPQLCKFLESKLKGSE
ncbi:hypothetical protein BKI52_43065 [marine bacterium AO1-C]|nr:hypothetical protein BKI52_43065 [marine bacterium AO1-C]